MHTKERKIMYYLICICLISIHTISLASEKSSSKIQEFNAVYASIPEDFSEKDFDKITRLFDKMDEVVIDDLNQHADINSTRELVSKLKGYLGPHIAQKTIIGNAVFFNEPDRQNSTYLLIDVNIAQSKYIVGIYSYNSYAPSRLSVYSKTEQKWVRTDKYDGEFPIYLYSFPEALNKGFFLTVETFIGGDRSEGNVKSWELKNGRLIKQGSDYDGLVDYQIQNDRSSLNISFTKILKHICEPVLGTRLLYKIAYQISDHDGLKSNRLSLTPWIEVLEHYFELIRDGKTDEASRLSTDKTVTKKLDKDYCGRILKQSGSLEKGEAYVDLTDNEDYRVELKEMNKTWLITGVTTLVSSSDKQ